MKKSWLKYLPVIASVILLIVDSSRVFRILFWPFSFIDGLSLVPEVLNTGQRFTLYGLWLGGILYFSALLWVALTRRNKAYLSVAVALAVFVTGYSLLNIPFGEQNQRRWHSMNQQAEPAWRYFLLNRDTQFYRITERQPFSEQEMIARFTEQTTPLKNLPLGWNKDDAAAADALWQQASGNRKQEAKALSKMADYLIWMPDNATLALASAIFTLTTDNNKMRAESAFRRAIAIAPDNPDAWLGWAVAQIQSHDDPQALHSQSQPLAVSINSGLQMAEGLKDKPRQSALSQRLATYIEEMPQDDRQILRILQARMRTRTCDVPPTERIKREADRVLPLRGSIVDKNPRRNFVFTDKRFPGHVVIEAEKYGIVAESLPELRYPNVDADIKSATTLLSLDINANGELLSALVECTSGVPGFDSTAIAYATQWRFKLAAEGRRVLMPVTFVSDRPSAKEYFQEMEARAIRIARLAARHNKAAMQAAAEEMVAQFKRMKLFFPQRRMSREEARALQSLYFKKGGYTTVDRMKAFDEMTKEMERLSEKYPYDVPLLKDLAFRKGLDPLEENRERWAKIMALAPNDPSVWTGWASLWGKVDPELYVGALVYSNSLLPSKPSSNQTLERTKAGLMLRIGMDDRNRILLARANTGYTDMLGSEGIDAREDDADTAKNIVPASTMLNRHEDIFPADPKGQMTADVKPQEIVSAPLSGVPLLQTPVLGNKPTELIVDIDKNGKPTLVLVSKSSQVEQYDAQAVNMIWRWKFKPQSSGRQITVGVDFSR